MALDRKYQKIFAKNAQSTDLGVVGSKNAGNPQYSTDIETLQSLTNWETGLRAQVSNSDAPYLQDQNSILYVITSQLAYLFQSGIAEWNSQTEYVANKSFVSYGGKIYAAKLDSTNKQPDTELAYWQVVNKDIFLNNGLNFESYYSYKKNDCVNYTDKYGNTIKVFSLTDNNTQEPTEQNVYNVKSKLEVDYVVSTEPTATEENYRQKILNTTSNVIKECVVYGSTYVWINIMSGGIGDVGNIENEISTVYEKSTGKYYDLNNSSFVDVTTLGYLWVNKEIYLMDSGFYENAWYKLYSNNFVEQGGKGSITPTTTDTYQGFSRQLFIPLDDSIAIQSILVYNTYYKQTTEVAGFTRTRGAKTAIDIYLYRNSSDSWNADTIYWEVKGFASQYKNYAEIVDGQFGN